MEFGLSDERLRTAIRLSNEAAAKDSAGHLPEAFELYKRALENWRVVCKFQQNPTLRERLYRRMDDYITRAEQLKQLLRQSSASHLRQRLLLYTPSPPKPLGRNSIHAAVTPPSRSPASPSFHNTPANASAADCTVTTVKSDADAAEGERIKQKLAHAILTEKPNFRWSDVAGLESAKEALQEAIILPSRFPSLFTGKTFLAKALAAEADATILSVSAADLVSKWQGESENRNSNLVIALCFPLKFSNLCRLVRSLFELARERRPSIIFIDEIDSMCGARSESDSESSRRMKTEFLIQMQGINFDLSEVLVLGATAREQLLRSGLGGTPHHLKDADFRHLAIELEGFSGSDISVLVRDALFEPIRRCRTATAFKQVMVDGRAFYVPCRPDDSDPTTRRMTLMSVPSDRLLPPEVTMVGAKRCTYCKLCF
ncbi:vacuolar sorting ATPase Vps4, putative [Eimeria acervulina]|uniref:Vacuolar sorting ATPase Vps4, putative n=1 Tax=Eimeria acervulina TaxID=5801 RepID=U6GSL4_EIMAC|nr:vacuolar sorting ATPase Vps4, putative [Eimeria acervulina]CDI83175.1 vacuolar sorting ATPase Vps4, putative [Eimeria acervulina]